jgi:hypothetical protein
MTLTLVTSRPTDPQLQFYIHKADLPGIYDPHTGHQQATDPQLQFYIHKADLPGTAYLTLS